MFPPMLQNNTSRPMFRLPECIPIYREDTVGGVHTTILTSIYSINMVAIIIFNILLVIGICKTRKKNKFTNSNKLFLFLCASDLLAGLVLMPLQIYYVNLVPNITCIRAGIRAFWSAFPVVLSGTNILVITFDRYLMMVNNNFYHKWFSGKWLLIGIVLMEITISLGWALWYVFTTQTIDKVMSAAFFIGLSIYQFGILFSVLVLNIKMVRHVKLSRKDTTLTSHNRAENILSRTISMISAALIICYIPGTVATGTAGFYALYKTDHETMRRVAISLIYCFLPTQINSAVNAMIYLSRNSRIKSYYKSLCSTDGHSTEGLDTNDSLASHKGMIRYTTKKQYHTYAMGPRSAAGSIATGSMSSLNQTNGELNKSSTKL